MKALYRHILSGAVLVLLAGLYAVENHLAREHRRLLTVQGIVADIHDSTQRAFVVAEDLRTWMDQDYGTYIGLRPDSVDLSRVETLMLSKSAVRTCEAWLPDDGYLHIRITQREPVVRFQTPDNGYYADADGFLFPLQRRYTARVPVVDGAIPLQVERGFKGRPQPPEAQRWLDQMLALLRQMDQSGIGAGLIGQITVLPQGDLVLIPREGREQFLFGPPTDVAAKLARLGRYYDTVAPAQEGKGYRKVDLRFAGQLVCKK